MNSTQPRIRATGGSGQSVVFSRTSSPPACASVATGAGAEDSRRARVPSLPGC